MSFIGKVASFVSESSLVLSLNSLLHSHYLAPLRHLIDDIFSFIFAKIKVKNAKRLLFCVGFYVMTINVGRFVLRTLPVAGSLISHYYDAASFNRLEFKKRYGANCWALITGFTEGIGFAFAQELARLKYNLVLVGRNKLKTENAIRRIKQIHPSIKIKVIELDFDMDSEKMYSEVYHKTSDLDVGILVNNVGTAVGGDFGDIERNKLLSTFNVNVVSMAELTRIFAIRLAQRVNKSAIINLSSCTGVFPSPRLGLYSFTKIYVDVFSRIIAEECSMKNIDVITYRPFGVSTPMMGMKKGPLMITPRECAETALHEVGRQQVSFGGLKHKISGIVFAGMLESARLTKYDAGFRVVQEGIRKGK